MMSKYEFDGVEWESGGYFACPRPPAGAVLSPDKVGDPWLAWAIILEQAKKGDFSGLPRLLQLYPEVHDHVFRQLCTTLLGDAGSTPVLDPLRARLQDRARLYSPSALNFSQALAARGLLADIPILLEATLDSDDAPDMALIGFSISEMLDRPGEFRLAIPAAFDSLEKYANAVRAAYQELASRYGGDQVIVFAGARLCIAELAETMRVALRSGSFSPEMRAKFETSTGIDCSSFYRDGVLQPLSAAAILEQFVASPAASRYEDGQRYFFGHRLQI